LIFLDTNVVSETLRPRSDARVIEWLVRHDAELALSSVVIAEIAFGIEKLRPDRRARRLQLGLDEWRERFAGRVFAFTEPAGLEYGKLMGACSRSGTTLATAGGMIAAIAIVHGGALATRNVRDFTPTGVTLIDPWNPA
jgi:predicted nucleic acid-binding protein